jgi:hypothetical protein
MGQQASRAKQVLAANVASPVFAPLQLTPDTTVKWIVEHLRAHPDFFKHCSGYSTTEISALVSRGESAYDNPLTITQDGYVVEGYALWQLAKLQKRSTIRCVVLQMNREQALLSIIDRNRSSKGLNDFVRILLALELESWFKERAKLNQRIGGREKGSSQLTEAHRVDVRQKIALAAGVSVANVSKVKHILEDAVPEIQEALRLGEISICRGADWAEISPTGQHRRLADGRQRLGIHRTIHILLKKHHSSHPEVCDGLRDIQRVLKSFQHEDCLSPLLESLGGVIRAINLLLERTEEFDHAA